MKNNNQVFKISRELYGDSTATYNNIPFTVLNRFEIGNISSFDWGDTSAGSEALSYAILDKVGSKEIANKYAKLYTKDVISKIKKDTWTLNATAVIQWINENTNYSIDESAFFKNGSTTYEVQERRQEEIRKEERRIQREKEFQEEAQRRLKLYEAKQQERSQEDRRVSAEKDFQGKSQKSLKEIQNLYQQELNDYKKQIIKQNIDIEAYQAQLKKYKLFVESLDIKSMYDKYCNLDNKEI
ncbi:DUF6166 domain-containing protein [Sulfurimonas sp.]|uniref:DUF6166 domain-containing protein n=1 Tax=Sulfurimonas sp. TaxID=2022749 RepID=UPI00356250DC